MGETGNQHQNNTYGLEMPKIDREKNTYFLPTLNKNIKKEFLKP
jgi:hypothetical protein